MLCYHLALLQSEERVSSRLKSTVHDDEIMTPPVINLKIEFSGGLELLFSNQRSYRVQIPSIAPSDNSTKTGDAAPHADSENSRSADITYLLFYLRDHLLKERVELFMDGTTVWVLFILPLYPYWCSWIHSRPGILVLVNDTDWELEGEGDYVLKDGDEIVFISTLHGG